MQKHVSSSERSADMPIELACESLHPVRCAAYFNASSPVSLVEVAMEHGARVHGFTPVFYSQNRQDTMLAVVMREVA